MNLSNKDLLSEALYLIRDIEQLQSEIELLEDFKNNTELKCFIMRPESKMKDDYSYKSKIDIVSKDFVIEMISKSQEDLREKIKIEEAKLEKIKFS
jgi:hypothetical protein